MVSTRGLVEIFATGLTLLLAGFSQVNAQNDPKPRPQISQLGDDVVSPRSDTAIPAAAGVDISLGDHCSPDYWIVSSRDCPQSGKQCDWSCCFDFFRFRNSDGCLRSGNAAEFQASLNPDYPVCIVVHGSFVGWDDVCHQSYHTYRWLRKACPEKPVQIVFFSWPSDSSVFPIPHHTITKLGRMAEYNGVHLATLIAHFPPTQPVTILGHSHGTRTAVSAMHLLGGGCIQGRYVADCDPSRRFHLIFAAGAIDHHWLNPGQRYDRALCRTDCIVNLINHRDIALAFYPLRAPFARQAVAISGFTRRDVASMGYPASQINEIDVTRLVGSHHMWPHYYRYPQIASELIPYVYFDHGDNATPYMVPSEDEPPVSEPASTTAATSRARSARPYAIFRSAR
ncbi:MAG: alpha/beta hydrolase [Planctomycetota bacterium]|nr:alpha/beta hydrolase [Planctomycetota bacterium]